MELATASSAPECEWTAEQESLLHTWKHQIENKISHHSKMAKRYSIAHYTTGVPPVFISGLTAIGIFSTFLATCNNANLKWIQFAAGMIVSLGSALGAVNLAVGFQKTYRLHKKTASSYAALLRLIDTVIATQPDKRKSPEKQMKKILGLFAVIAKSSKGTTSETLANNRCVPPAIHAHSIPKLEEDIVVHTHVSNDLQDALRFEMSRLQNV